MSEVNLPKGRSLAGEYAKTLTAQSNIMPSLLAAQAQWQPIQSANELSNLNAMLLGTEGYDYETQEYVPAVYREGNKYSYGRIPEGVSGTIDYPTLPDPTGTKSSGGNRGFLPGLPGIGGSGGGGFSLPGIGGGGGGKGIVGILDPLGFSSGGPLGSLFGGDDDKPKKRLVSGSGYKTTKHHIGPQRGLLDIYSKDIAPTLGELERAELSKQRAGDIADVQTLGPAALKAFMDADPETAALIEELTQQSQAETRMGGNLSPADLRMVQQGVRGRQAGMLGGTGNAGDYGEALGISAYGQQLRNNRRAFANDVVGLRNRVYGDAFQRVLGRPGAGLSGASNVLGQAQGMTGGGALSLLNPESGYAGDLYNTNFSSLVGGALSNAKMKNDLYGAGISAIGNIAGGAMGMI